MSTPDFDAEESQEQQPLPAYRDPARRQRVNGFAIASLVCGILGWLPFVFVLALAFASTAKRHVRERGDGGEGLATAGMVLGWVWFAFFLFEVYGYWTM